MKTETQNDLLEIISHYGVKEQLKHMATEQFELTEAILEYENCKFTTSILNENPFNFEYLREHIAEELADNFVMLEQLMIKYEIDNILIENIMRNKIKRQIERIKNDKDGISKK